MSEWTKGPVGHKETCWWNDVINSVSEKEEYLERKKKARRTV